jgi:hypothetical protein
MSDAKQQPLRFSDFAAKDGSLDGTKIKLDDVLNKEILVLDFRVSPSKYQRQNTSECLTIQFEFTDAPGVHHVVFTGSTVLTKTLQQYKDNLPFITTIRKVDKFYKFT